jgi:hypothetical protein
VSNPFIEPSQSLVAATLSAGVWLGLIDRADVILWADHCIERVDQPPIWLIDLSLSHHLHVPDVMKLLEGARAKADAADTCRALYGFVPNLSEATFAAAERFAWRLYEIARYCFDYGWNNDLVCLSDELHDTAILCQDGTFAISEKEIAVQAQDFLDRNRDFAVWRLIADLRSRHEAKR